MDSLDKQRIAYIEAYRDLAILEMYKSGIPASITLAQGLLETGAGTSFLARTANNHFGMKCGDRWYGERTHKHDDEFDQSGDPVKSCFRSYKDPAQNFSDHSDFLRDPQKYNRYGGLFLLDPLDYVAWGTGLQASGYSPVGHYSARIIEHIERYRLHEIDYRAWEERKKVPANKRIVFVNDLRLVRALEGETPAEIARACNLDAGALLRYNEDKWLRNTVLTHGTPVFLEEKKDAWETTELEFYFSHEGKSMFEIGQLFGIKEKALRDMNGINDVQEPALKAKVRLKGNRLPTEKMAIAKKKITSPVPQKPKNKKPPMVPVVSEFPVNARNTAHLNQVLDTEFNMDRFAYSYTSKQIKPAPETEEIVIERFTEVVTAQNFTEERTVGRVIFHEVEKGETLLSISRRYGTPVDNIRKINNLQNDNIRIGQRLRVK